MSHSVPNWNLDDASIPASRLTATNSSGVPFLGYEMAELTWENGQLSVNGLTRVSNPTTAKDAWDNPRAAVGTLESIVDLATQKPPPPPMDKGDYDDVGVPWLDCRNHDQRSSPVGSSAAASVSDALVPCGTPKEEEREGSRVFRGKGISTCVVDRSARVKKRMPTTRVPVEGERSSQQSLSVSSLGGSESRHVLTADTCEKDSGGFGVATASFCSQGTTLSLSSSDKPATTLDNHGSVCLTRSPQGDTCDKEDTKKGKGARSSLSTKRSRTAAIHNQSERKRRDTINQKMKMLQKMVPNSSKTDKASMLDEVIDYLKQLQAQVHMMMMSRMSIQSMMMPFAMPHHPLHMPMMGMDMSIINPIMARQNLATLSPLLNPSAAFMPMASWNDATTNPSPSSAPLGSSDPSTCQSQPMSMEAYTRMVALIQQQQHQVASAKN